MTEKSVYCYGCGFFDGSARPAKCDKGFRLSYVPWDENKRYGTDWGWKPTGITRCKWRRPPAGPPDEVEVTQRLGADVVAKLKLIRLQHYR